MRLRLPLRRALLLVLFGIGVCQRDASAQQAPSQQPVALSPWVLYGEMTQGAPPEYPKEARKKHIQGDVTINVLVDPNGNVSSASWVNDGTSALLGAPCLQAIRKWKYQPTLLDGNPAPVASWVVVRFQLADRPTVQILTRDESSTPVRKVEKVHSRKLRISSGVADSIKISGKDPIYPFEARLENIQGDVFLQASIDEKGNIATLEIISGDPILVEASLEAVRYWRYKPWVLNGEPVTMETTIFIKFHM